MNLCCWCLQKYPASAAAAAFHGSICSPLPPLGTDLVQQGLPSEVVKWTYLGVCRALSFATGYSALQPKSLDSIIDLQRAETLSSEDLITIWNEYHLGRGHIHASMKRSLYNLLVQRTNPCQHFVVPLWRGSGYTTMFVQARLPHMLITGLEDYKARGTQAAPYLTVTYYTEFASSKDVVLIRGDIVLPSKLEDEEGRRLLETMHSFYLNDERYKLVERFNKDTHEFEFKDVLRALDIPIG
ncbi:hypothetical protein AMTR_s00055p00226650 [Amborella trichopoda]|uniref:ATP synthase mitochondrial F1 complex assembly factor 1 n=1 Tax=Amborella trichopoda TaxID=13333 RepID=U5CYG6_AMBTC|nr:hypothetical protein AMTR_s00055p00226650 [Amborella trichopoda]